MSGLKFSISEPGVYAIYFDTGTFAWDRLKKVGILERYETGGGEGYGIVGTDWDSDDPINGPYDGEIERCNNCRGSGLAKDCTYW